jgi:hypothetical protein
MAKTRTFTPGALVRERARAAAGAPNLAELLRGTLRRRYVRCGKAKCRCQKGRGHGPFLYLSVTLGPGRTEQLTVAPGDAAVARTFLRNYRQLIEIVKRVSEANRQLLRQRSLKDSLLGRKVPRLRGRPTRRRKQKG